MHVFNTGIWRPSFWADPPRYTGAHLGKGRMNLALAYISKGIISKDDDFGCTEKEKTCRTCAFVLWTDLQSTGNKYRGQGQAPVWTGTETAAIFFLFLCLGLQQLNKMQSKCYHKQKERLGYCFLLTATFPALPPQFRTSRTWRWAVLFSAMERRRWVTMANQQEVLDCLLWERKWLWGKRWN